MKSELPRRQRPGEHRQQATSAIKRSLRELRFQLALLNRRIGARVDLKDIDHDCLDLIARDGQLSPTTLAQRAGLHPATMTGVLDRLERSGWIARERVDADRRAVLVSAQPARVGKVASHYVGMNSRLDAICDSYSEAELDLIADFLRRTAEAGHAAAEELAAK
jgi:DNA-binding MarR family transcriptional regulator